MPFKKLKNWLMRSGASAQDTPPMQVMSSPIASAPPQSISSQLSTAEDDPACLEHIREWINFEARSGFTDQSTALEHLQDLVEDEGLEYHPAWKVEMETALEQQRLREASFPDITANDRLTSAFIEMNTQGLIALENAGYTQSDGWDDLRELYFENGKTAKGGVFYHRQDLERGILGLGLNIRFGGFGKDTDDLEIGRKAVEILKKHGFKPIWDEDPNRVIDLPPFEWQRRSTA